MTDMQTFAVELRIRIFILADNPGQAVSQVTARLTEPLAKHEPQLFNASKVEALAYPAANLATD